MSVDLPTPIAGYIADEKSPATGSPATGLQLWKCLAICWRAG